MSGSSVVNNLSKTYEQRVESHSSSVAQKLLRLAAEKQSNLCASLDVRTTAELLDLADKVGPHVVVIKTHIDIIDDFDYEKTVGGLSALVKKHKFLVFEDRKFADIGSTVKAQYVGGAFKIAQWSDFTNAHGVPGAGIIAGLREGAQETTNDPRGLIMLAELSSKGSLATGEYTEKVIQMSRDNKDFVFGFIAQNRPAEFPGDDWLVLTPGVGLDETGDGLGQQYRTVDAVISKGSDFIIVGRGLYGKGRDPVAEAKRYQTAGWAAYLERIGAA